MGERHCAYLVLEAAGNAQRRIPATPFQRRASNRHKGILRTKIFELAPRHGIQSHHLHPLNGCWPPPRPTFHTSPLDCTSATVNPRTVWHCIIRSNSVAMPAHGPCTVFPGCRYRSRSCRPKSQHSSGCPRLVITGAAGAHRISLFTRRTAKWKCIRFGAGLDPNRLVLLIRIRALVWSRAARAAPRRENLARD